CNQKVEKFFSSGMQEVDHMKFAVAVPVAQAEADRAEELRRTIAIEKLEAQLKGLREPKAERDEIDDVLRKIFNVSNRERKVSTVLDGLEKDHKTEAAERARRSAREKGLSAEETEEHVQDATARVEE